MNASSVPGVVPLRSLTREDAVFAGGKASTLGVLLNSGFDVPDGFIVTGEAGVDVFAAAAALGEPWAVRSSAAAEDLPDASFAGQYETVLDVRGRDQLAAAIRQCRDSAAAGRVAVYRTERKAIADSRMAVLVQKMVAADAAGVAFTANPLTGARDEVVITAGRGAGERVVGGDATADEWHVRGGKAVCTRSIEQALQASQSANLATVCIRIEKTLGGPQDIEWALCDGRLFILQARPMTALVAALPWRPPTPGHWMRNFRLGEWLPEAITPLFQDWLLERVESGYLLGMTKAIGAPVAFRRAVVNGWYYTTTPRCPPLIFLRAAFQSRGRIFSFLLNGLVRVGSRPEVADQRLLRRLLQTWRVDTLPRYRQLVATRAAKVETATSDELVRTIDEVGTVAGEALWSLAIVGGSAWKMEACLARFLRRHAAGAPTAGVQSLLSNLPGSQSATAFAPHAVHSFDWCRPTAGELREAGPNDGATERRERGVAAREQAERECRAALDTGTGHLGRFETLLEVAQRYAVIREEQAGLLTLGWPLLRRSVLRLAEAAVAAKVIRAPDDAFFLTRVELLGASDCNERVGERRANWERQRRLLAPLAIGTHSWLFERGVKSAVDAVRPQGRESAGAVLGHPASPGRATGAVRLIQGPQDFDRLKKGDVLVAKGTAPAWTPLFARAAAIVTDGGSLAAHASLVAREYGIPAVVGTGDATARLREGQVVTVDGSVGIVEVP